MRLLIEEIVVKIPKMIRITTSAINETVTILIGQPSYLSANTSAYGIMLQTAPKTPLPPVPQSDSEVPRYTLARTGGWPDRWVNPEAYNSKTYDQPPGLVFSSTAAFRHWS